MYEGMYETIICNKCNSELSVREGCVRDGNPACAHSRHGLVLDEDTLDAVCTCSETKMERVDKGFPEMVSIYECMACGKSVTVVWD